MDANRMDGARRELVEMIARCRQSNERLELVRALKRLGQIERDLGNLDTALGYYEEAAKICRGEPDVLPLAHTLRHLGDIYQDADRLSQADGYYDETLSIYRGQTEVPPLDLANALRSIALLKARMGDVQRALALWAEAGELYRRAGVDEGVAESMRQVARLTTQP